MKILFLGKQEDQQVDKALKFCQNNFAKVDFYLGKWKETFPKDIEGWQGDYIISYLSRWIIPASVLTQAKIAAINFHPAPPNYPGFGCINFALYEGASEYGVTCHHMNSHVDTGTIIAVKKFPVFQTDNVESLLVRTHDHQLSLFYEVMSEIVIGNALPISTDIWTRKPFTRKDFNKLDKITFDMSQEEIARRVKATTFGDWKPTIELHGFIFEVRKNG